MCHIRYSEWLAEAEIQPSVVSRGDNALAETISCLYKTELIHRRDPWTTREALEIATLEWAHWFNHQRILELIGSSHLYSRKNVVIKNLIQKQVKLFYFNKMHSTKVGVIQDFSHYTFALFSLKTMFYVYNLVLLNN